MHSDWARIRIELECIGLRGSHIHNPERTRRQVFDYTVCVLGPPPPAYYGSAAVGLFRNS
jgi:hypothetical protein